MKKNILVIVLFLLAGCTQFMANITGLNFLHDRRAREDILTDEAIEKEAYRKITAFSELTQKARVKVSVYNAKVLVTGEANTAVIRDKIIANIRIIKNIRVIYNELLIKPIASEKSINNDAVISEKLKGVLLEIQNYSDFDETRIKVIVSSKNVYLMGLVYENEAQTVGVKMQKIEGIRSIVTLFEYIDQKNLLK